MAQHMVIFDFDGVLADSWWLTHKTSKKAYPGLTEDEHRRGFEGNIYDTEQAWQHLERVEIDYFGEYQKEMHLVKFFEEMEIVAKELSQKYLLSIVSSSTSNVIHRYLEREGISDCFSDVMGADIHTRKHTKIEMLFEKYGLSPVDCIMITDTTGDIKEAAMVKVPSIGVAWGFHSVETLQKEKPLAIAERPRDIVALVETYFSAHG